MEHASHKRRLGAVLPKCDGDLLQHRVVYSAALATGDEAAIATVREQAGVGEATRVPTPGVFEDSLRPLADAGLLRLVEVDGQEVLPGVRFVGTRGHSIDHATIEITSGGSTGMFGGDILHHPAEVSQPELVSMFCARAGASVAQTSAGMGGGNSKHLLQQSFSPKLRRTH